MVLLHIFFESKPEPEPELGTKTKICPREALAPLEDICWDNNGKYEGDNFAPEAFPFLRAVAGSAFSINGGFVYNFYIKKMGWGLVTIVESKSDSAANNKLLNELEKAYGNKPIVKKMNVAYTPIATERHI